jgi:hypothetical protein
MTETVISRKDFQVPGVQLCTYSAVEVPLDKPRTSHIPDLLHPTFSLNMPLQDRKHRRTLGRFLNIQPLSFRIALDDFSGPLMCPMNIICIYLV